MQPMLATRGDHVPQGPEWTHEVKWDGIRALVEVTDGTVPAPPAEPQRPPEASPPPAAGEAR